MSQADLHQPQTPEGTARGPVALIASPHAGSAQGTHPQELLERAGVSVALSLPVTALDIREPQGQRWRDAGCVAAVAAGGDGTVGAVATHAVAADLPMGILPLGTANDVARALGIPLEPAGAAAVIAWGELRAIDAGQALPARTQPHAAAQETETAATTLTGALAGESDDSPASGAAYFLHALTLGVNVEFARLATDTEQRRLWGRLTYVASAIESLGRLRPIAVKLSFSGMAGAAEDEIVVVQGETALFTAINLPVFGGRLGLRVPGIRTNDRLLDFILVEAPDPRGARAALEAALDGLTHAAQTSRAPQQPGSQPAGQALPGGRWFRARAVEIETEQPVELTLDGELRGRTPAVARVAPSAVQVIVPRGQG